MALVSGARLHAIEWGGDVHVPPGDYGIARETGRMTRDAGLRVASYGSYYRAGETDPAEFTEILKTAQALGAPAIRVWAGKLGSAQADRDYRKKVVNDAVRIANMATSDGLRVVCEWHGGTLTDTAESAATFFEETEHHPGLWTWWQPRTRQSFEASLSDIHKALPHIMGLHVFHWDAVTGERLPLSDGEHEWIDFLGIAAPVMPPESYALLEFVRNDDPDQFWEDAATLKRWLEYPAGSPAGALVSRLSPAV